MPTTRALISTCARSLRRRDIFTDVVFDSVDKLFLYLHPVDVGDKRIGANKDLSAGLTTINSRGVRIDGICGDKFITSFQVKSWRRRPLVFLENCAMRHPGILSLVFLKVFLIVLVSCQTMDVTIHIQDP